MYEKIYNIDATLEGKFYYRCNELNSYKSEQEVVARLSEAIFNASRSDGDIVINNVEVELNLVEKLRKIDPSNPFRVICNILEEQYLKKNADYGNSFGEQLDSDGLLVSKIRLMDKVKRFSTLITSEAQIKTESIEDTLGDLASYAIMTLIWMSQSRKINK